MGNIDFTPRYIQIAQHLQALIENGAYKSGDRLPSEKELMTQFGISRITATAALDELVKAHLAYQQRGRGTFVAKAMIRNLSFFSSFTEDMRARGLSPSSKLLSLDLTQPDQVTLEKLQMPADAAYYRLVRLRLTNQEPAALQYAYLPALLYPGLDKVDFNQRYLYEVIREDYGMKTTWSEAIVEAAPATDEEAAHLEISAGTPVLVIWHLTLDDEYTPVEYVRSVYQADRFSFSTGRNPIQFYS